jgi:uncharacterized protein (TIGR02611 family)
MFKNIKRRWESVKRGEPGHRFQDEYDKRHGENSSRAKKIGMLVVGAIVLVAGIILMPAPGPGILIVAIGGAMLAQESRIGARILDAAEVRGRALIQWARGVWERAPLAGKVAIALVALNVAAGALYLAYRIMFK